MDEGIELNFPGNTIPDVHQLSNVLMGLLWLKSQEEMLSAPDIGVSGHNRIVLARVNIFENLL